MPAPISVIIPTLNASATIGPCLGAVALGLDAGLIAEVIIVDGGSGDDIVTVADLSGARLLVVERGRGGQLAKGAAAAKADWLLFVHADTVLDDNWTNAVLTQLNNREKAGYFRLRFDAKGFAPTLFAAWANLRSRVFGLPYGDQGLLIHRDTYAEIGGHPEIPLMEDVAIARRLKGRLTALRATATTSADKYRQQGWFRRGTRNLWLLFRYFTGGKPEDLASRY